MSASRKTEMDNLEAPDRRRAMQAVRSRDTKPELRVRKRAHAIGLRFRLHRRDLHGTPDLVFPRRRTALFVHGCFWHGHSECQRSALPKTNAAFWSAKIEKNKARDQVATAALQRLGWKVIVIWECETHSTERIDQLLLPLFRAGDLDGPNFSLTNINKIADALKVEPAELFRKD